MMRSTRFIAAGSVLAMFSMQAVAVEVGARLYGDLRYSVVHSDVQEGADDTEFSSNNSHLGVALSGAEGDISVTGVYELGIDAGNTTNGSDDTRQAYLSVGSPFGSLALGQLETAYKRAGQQLDPFYNTGVGTITGTPFGNAGAPVLGPGFGLSALTSDTVDQGLVADQVAYVSPTIANLTGNAAIIFGDNDGGDGGQEDFGVGVEYAADGILFGVQYLDIRSTVNGTPSANFNAGLPNATKATRVYGGYATEVWSLGASWEPLEIEGAPDRDYYFLSGTLNLNDRTRLAASLGYVENVPFEGQSLSLGCSTTCSPVWRPTPPHVIPTAMKTRSSPMALPWPTARQWVSWCWASTTSSASPSCSRACSWHHKAGHCPAFVPAATSWHAACFCSAGTRAS